MVRGFQIYGAVIDDQTRCKHYASPVDIIAIKFPCCDRYYPCYWCHEEEADHPAQVWKEEDFSQKVILCGACGYELTIQEYMTCHYVCPACHAKFNPGCEKHASLYFENCIVK
jgi:uncharacterized CHY-type Zn-finger protein